MPENIQLSKANQSSLLVLVEMFEWRYVVLYSKVSDFYGLRSLNNIYDIRTIHVLLVILEKVMSFSNWKSLQKGGVTNFLLLEAAS